MRPRATANGAGTTALLSAQPLIWYEDVRLEWDGQRVLTGATGEVPATGISVMVGPSGSGKSTLLRLANRLEVPTAGRVMVLGEDTAATDPLALRRRVGMVFQRPTVFPGTVVDNIRVADPELDDLGVTALLARVGLSPALADRDAGTLSGGEAQRACVARSLAAGPAALLMDEPTSSLDPGARDEIERLAFDLARRGLPVVWVTHDQSQMRRLADWVLVVIGGRITYAGPPDGLPGAGVETRAFVGLP